MGSSCVTFSLRNVTVSLRRPVRNRSVCTTGALVYGSPLFAVSRWSREGRVSVPWARNGPAIGPERSRHSSGSPPRKAFVRANGCEAQTHEGVLAAISIRA
jgi:hypothetical protein